MMNRRDTLRNLSILGIAPIVDILFARVNAHATENLPGSTPAFTEIKEIAKDVFFAKGKLNYFTSGNFKEVECNNGWIIFDDFVLLVDSNFPASTVSLLQEIRKTTDKPVRYVFNTHHHGDHLYGNRFWFEQGATPIAYAGVASELKKHETGYYAGSSGRWEATAYQRQDLRNYPLLPPVLSFTDRLIIEDKHKRIELLHLGPGHTKGDGVLWIPRDKILFAGDSCLNGPYNLFMDAEVETWISTLDKMDALQPTILVPGHGALGSADTPSRQRKYISKLLAWVKAKKNKGDSTASIVKQLPELRQIILSDEEISHYLIPEPSIAPGFSLEAQVKRIFDQIQ